MARKTYILHIEIVDQCHCFFNLAFDHGRSVAVGSPEAAVTAGPIRLRGSHGTHSYGILDKHATMPVVLHTNLLRIMCFMEASYSGTWSTYRSVLLATFYFFDYLITTLSK